MPDGSDFQINANAEIVEVWEHPDGKVIAIYADDTYDCIKGDRRASTSATPEKLRAGYGRWKLVPR